MSYIVLSGITGCFSPSSGETLDLFDTKYNKDFIISFSKKNYFDKILFKEIYCVNILFMNYTQLFKFYNVSDRDTFYSSI
jgi:hypothetical protein